MSIFKKYKKVERIEKEECRGLLLEGKNYIFEKIDGANAQIYLDSSTGDIAYGSRNRVIGVGSTLLMKDDLRGLGSWVNEHYDDLNFFFSKNPNITLYGEFLVKHTVIYSLEFYNKFYIFDLYDSIEKKFIPWGNKIWDCLPSCIPIIKPDEIVENCNIEDLKKYLEMPSNYGAQYREGIVIKNYCVTPDMKVLKSDLTYIPIENIKIGDRLVGFDENSGVVQNSTRYRWFKESKVIHIHKEKQEVYELILSDNSVLKCTSEHKWLVVRHSCEECWRETKNIKIGSRIKKILPVWETNVSYEAGYLQGVFDGEGSLVHAQNSLKIPNIQVVFNQLSGEVLNKTINYLESFGFKMSNIGSGNSSTQKYVIKGGKKENIRFLGSIRPQRLLDKVNINKVGGIRTQNNNNIFVVSKKSLGVQDIIVMKTSTGTFICEGYGAHNCFINKYGRNPYGKLLNKDFMEVKGKTKKNVNPEDIEIELTNKYCTKARIIKICENIKDRGIIVGDSVEIENLEMKHIPQVINMVLYDIITEDINDMMKRFRYPTIDFKKLRFLVFDSAKKYFVEYLEKQN